ncbi:hypothetical protein QE429_002868 [Bacillus sp. SORGH_AS 510]|uniref:hypothetical protein n=1 Tax=Bacillus sp. SORGH_AS_0510 TaxID=3041771 RepID=UPI0027838198|nr:hypothetical protein [Bacillus sp. SORGH_AS_0510]MDQ1146041.1 hypothetical protein [Bacillus sp. SORGH_AS_0510]
MSLELLSKNTAEVFHAFISQPHWDKVEREEGIKKVLIRLRDGVDSEEEYLEELLKYVTFQYANTNTAISFLAQCIEEEQFFPLEIFHSVMADVPKQVEETNFLEENMPRFQQLVYQGSDIKEQVIHAEGVYFHTKIVNDLLVEFIGTFLHPDNRDYMVNFLEYSSKVVIDMVMYFCQTHSNLIAEELNTIHSSK